MIRYSKSRDLLAQSQPFQELYHRLHPSQSFPGFLPLPLTASALHFLHLGRTTAFNRNLNLIKRTAYVDRTSIPSPTNMLGLRVCANYSKDY